MTAPLPVLGEKHIYTLNFVAIGRHKRTAHHDDFPVCEDRTCREMRDIEAHVRALVAGEVVEVSRNVAIHLREAHADWLTPQTQEKPE